ncbi:Short-chain dehydrogenase TIC 32, chloroplastic [Capsicum annuum]|uniref:Short-chain dehydrogenase TIC 32, chloroplastic n=1 Tax=Capsicum annuum TaxID=4072 RepID=A0A2G2ZZ99_CAPAN|nr:Short-chain dehydrogenase TIC 32, chloroplastic [Capsicum annuum]
MENRIIEDIDKVEKVKSSSSDGVINLDQFLIQVCIMLMGLIIKDTSRIMFQNQQNNVDNDNNIIDNAPIQEIVNKSNISLRRYKARLIVKVFNQRKDIDFDEMFSPVVKMTSIRIVLDLVASLDLEIEQMNVKMAFLHSGLEKKIYMKQLRASRFDPILKGYTNADMTDDLDNKRSTTKFLFTFSRRAISWQLKLQKCVALSTIEVYIVAIEAGKEMVRLKNNGESGFSSTSTAEEVTHGIDGSSLTAIVTGASSGIGAETSRVLALRGGHVIMAVRNIAAGNGVKEAIVKEVPAAKVDIMELDLSSLASVRKCAADLISSGHSLNMLMSGGNSLYAFQRQHRAAICHKSSRYSCLLGVCFLCKIFVMPRVPEMSWKGEWTEHEAAASSSLASIVRVLHAELDCTDTGCGVSACWGWLGLLALFGVCAGYRWGDLGTSALATWCCQDHEVIHSTKRWEVCQGHFLLTNLLLNKMEETTRKTKREGRIVNVSSVGYCIFTYREGIRFDRISDPKSYSSFWAYGQSKLANILHTYELTRRLKGASTTCYVALHPQLRGVSGEYFSDNNLATMTALAKDADLAKRLWDFSMDLVK